MTIPGSSSPSERIALGAHLDSINRSDETKAPGADDDASGIAALTEIIRIIKAKNMQFQRTIEFHAYAAEEDGLIGSKDIATNAQSDGKIITAMLQLDMIGYSSSPEEILHIITTDTSPILVRHLKDLASNYLGNTWQTAELAAGTSDHRSWTSNGFHAAFAFENPLAYNHALHTENDTIERINFSLAAKFTKLALAFLSHEAGYTAAVADTADQWVAQKATSSIIKLASIKSSTGGNRLVAAVEGAATTAEFCKIKSGLEVGCQSMVNETSLEKQKSNRVFFLSASDLTINEDDIWRVSAYSSSGELVAMRRMRLKKN
jgi:Zn-dependent M28 family amino/carboxypeptidase